MRRTAFLTVALAILGVALTAQPAAAVTCSPAPTIQARPGEPITISANCPGSSMFDLQMVITHHTRHGYLQYAFGPVRGAVRYVPDPGYEGPDEFSYYGARNAGQEPSSEVVQPINVSDGANQAPSCGAATAAPYVRQGSSRPVRFSCTDPDSDPLTVEIVTPPSSGTLSAINAGGATYQATAVAEDSFAYRVSDGHGGTSNTVTQPVHAVDTSYNTAPTCTGGSMTVHATSASSPEPLSAGPSCTDADGDSLTTTLVTAPTKGHAAVYPGGFVTYDADIDDRGADAFTFKANDGRADSATVSVDVTILAPRPPRCQELNSEGERTAYANEDYTIRLHCAPVDNGYPIQFHIASGPAHGTLTPQTSTTMGQIDYVYHQTDPSYRGPDQFSWYATSPDYDGTPAHIAASDTRTWSFTVADRGSANRPPACGAGYRYQIVVRNDTTKDARLDCRDHDTGDDNAVLVTSPPAHGTVTSFDSGADEELPRVQYTPNAGYDGLDSFVVKVDDGRGGQSAAITVNVEVLRAGYNRPPACGGSGEFVQPGETRTVELRCPDDDADAVTYTIASPPTHGTATLVNGGKSLRYTSEPGYVGHDPIDVLVTDALGATAHMPMTMHVGVTTTAPPGSPGYPGGGGGGGSSPATAPSTAPEPEPEPAPSAGPSPTPTPAPSPTPSRSTMPVVRGLDLGDVTARLTSDSDDGTVPVSGTHAAKLMTLECADGCTVDATIEFVLPGASGRAVAAKVIRGAKQRLKLAPGKRGTVTLKVPSAVRKRVQPNATIKVRVTITVRHADGTAKTGTKTFKVKLRR